MKSLLLYFGILLVVGPSASFANANILSEINNSDRTPYEILENAFNDARPAKFKDFEDLLMRSTLEDWVFADTKVAKKAEYLAAISFPVIYFDEIIPSVPSSGPLFPGKPESRVRKILGRTEFFYIENGQFQKPKDNQYSLTDYMSGHEKCINSDNFKEFVNAAETSAGIKWTLQVHMLSKCRKETENVKYESHIFRIYQGMIIIKAESYDFTNNKIRTAYIYYW